MKVPGRLVGAARDYQIRLDLAALTTLEDLTGRPSGDVLHDVTGPTPQRSDVVALLRAIVIDPPLRSEADVEAMIRDLGGWRLLADVLGNPALAEFDHG
jgi:hypothetical protein